jgi:capsular exopolysaccharide synthesis family protein
MNTTVSPASAVSQTNNPGPEATDGEFRYELSPELVTLHDSRPHEAEAIRTVRTHIVARHLEDGRRGVAVCAPTRGVGCTFTAANLAVSLAQAGVATLLIDADLRTPQVDTFIRPQANKPGLKDCIASPERTLNDCIHAEVLPNLSILYSGGRADSPQELLASDRFKEIIERCLRDFEFTVIDTSAADMGADDLRVARIVGYAVIVAKSHTTKVNELTELAGMLHEDGAKVIGTILNDI